MKSIVVNAVIHDATVDVDAVRRALAALGAVVEISLLDEYETAKEPENAEHVWIYISADEAAPYIKVAGPGDTAGTELSNDEIDSLRRDGVCVGLTVVYPDVDRYGTPLHATSDVAARGYVGDHLFKVSRSADFVTASCSHDDSAESAWLQIAVSR